MSSGPADSRYSPAYEAPLSEEAKAPASPAASSASAGKAAPAEVGLWSSLLTAGVAPTDSDRRWEQFLHESRIERALELALGSIAGLDKEQIVQRLSRAVARIDDVLNDQLNAILHHPAFQKLEASWRGLDYLVSRADDEGEAGIKIRVLSASWRELERDFERAVEFDQSQLFRKIYSDEFGTPGGEPIGALVGDYEIHPRPSREHPHDDIAVLKSISEVAAAAFCPFLAAASPAMFELDQFSGLEQSLDLARTLEQVDYVKWRALRDTEDSRFVGLTMPRVLMRLPYEDDGTRVDSFRFREEVAGPDRSKYLWGNAAYALGAVLVRTYAQSGWLAGIRGVERGVEGGGLVTGLPVHSFSTDAAGVAPKCSTDVIVTDSLEKELSDEGFIPLCHCQDTEYSAFYSNLSIQKPKKYDRPAATANAKMSAMLQYILCVSQFAHYLKVLARDKVGMFTEASECQTFLERWISKYVTADERAGPDVKARYPLREAKVDVRPHPGNPGHYLCTVHLWPHFELDELTAAVRIKTELAPGVPA